MSMISRRVFLLMLAVPFSHAMACAGGSDTLAQDPGSLDKVLVYVGSYAKPSEPGIHIFKLDLHTGAFTPVGSSTGVSNPSFVAVHPSRKFLYAVAETGDFGAKNTGAVAAFSIRSDNGTLQLLNQVSSEGQSPCYVTVDKEGKNALVANYSSGSIACVPIREDGTLKSASAAIQHSGSGSNPQRQAGPHAHSINLDQANHFAFAADLGLDKILIYKYDPAAGNLVSADEPFVSVPPGSGPRHFAFHPSGRFAYACGEMTSTVIAFSYDPAKGMLKELQVLSTLPEPVKGNSTAEVQVHPTGKFVYVSNRGHDSIAIFTVDPASGLLTAAGHVSTGGKTPRNFGIEPTGKYLIAANQGSDSLIVFRIDPVTGKPEPTGQKASVPKPVCVKFLPWSK
jgi:6-phosphogluconolactonase